MKSTIIPIFKAFQYSKQGLLKAAKTERALRQEFIILLVLIILIINGLYFLERFTFAMAVVLLISWLFVIVVELLNTAMEKVADSITLEHHPMIGYAKDLGSAAVLVALTIFLLVLSCIAYFIF